MLDLPLSFAAQGIPVFPCRAAPEIINGRRYVAKSPIPTNGYKGATTSERIIRIWADRHHGCLWGMPTGRATGVWVLDIDAKHGASPESLPHPLPPTRMVRTGSGGWHVYFAEAGLGCGTGRLPAGIDVRGNGGLVILPGNPGYTLESDAPVADAPEWLLALIRPKPYVPRPGVPYQPQDHDAYVSAALRAELDQLAGWRVERGAATFRAACKLGELVGAGALSRSEAEAGLFDACLRNGLVETDGARGVEGIVKRGLDRGEANPRQLPERDGTQAVDMAAFIARNRRAA